ncbi:MAG: putative rane protein [Myxococcaceae bacterium]|nr:putative rane protein [Myxococcaceae bacterium]
MSVTALLPTLLGLLALVVVGVIVGRTGRLGVPADRAAGALTALVVDVTLPALTLDVLLRARLTSAVAWSLVPSTASLLACLAAGWVVSSLAGWSRPVRGTVMVCAAFCNTSFLGVPITRALFPDRTDAVQAAVLIDTVDTTALLWTVGIALAQHFGERRGADGAPPRLRALLLRPATLAVIVGLPLNLLGVTAPPALLALLQWVGATTSVLVFLALGLRLDLSVLRGQRAPLLASLAIKLALSPLLALLAARALSLHGAPIAVSVLQSSMPAAVIAAAVATQERCDDRLAAAIVMSSLALSLPCLWLWSPVLRALAG